MLTQSQPLDPKFCEKMKLDKNDEFDCSEKEIKTQFIGKMFDDSPEENKKRKITLGLRLYWFWRSISDGLYDIKYAIRNYFKWYKTIRQLRPWEGFSGLTSVMITHLNDYIDTEEKYGH